MVVSKDPKLMLMPSWWNYRCEQGFVKAVDSPMSLLRFWLMKFSMLKSAMHLKHAE